MTNRSRIVYALLIIVVAMIGGSLVLWVLLRAEGRVMKAGQSTIFCEGEARDEKGALVAKAIGTFRAISPK